MSVDPHGDTVRICRPCLDSNPFKHFFVEILQVPRAIEVQVEVHFDEKTHNHQSVPENSCNQVTSRTICDQFPGLGLRILSWLLPILSQRTCPEPQSPQVAFLGAGAFAGCSLVSLRVPSSVMRMAAEADVVGERRAGLEKRSGG